jgi:hypothetical protein
MGAAGTGAALEIGRKLAQKVFKHQDREGRWTAVSKPDSPVRYETIGSDTSFETSVPALSADGEWWLFSLRDVSKPVVFETCHHLRYLSQLSPSLYFLPRVLSDSLRRGVPIVEARSFSCGPLVQPIPSTRPGTHERASSPYPARRQSPNPSCYMGC